jgi:hypothetical protein
MGGAPNKTPAQALVVVSFSKDEAADFATDERPDYARSSQCSRTGPRLGRSLRSLDRESSATEAPLGTFVED